MAREKTIPHPIINDNYTTIPFMDIKIIKITYKSHLLTKKNGKVRQAFNSLKAVKDIIKQEREDKNVKSKEEKAGHK